MTYKQIKNLEEKEFKRLCGVKPKLFEEIVDVLKEKSLKGRPRGEQIKLGAEDQLIKSQKFSLPGKKSLSATETEWSVVIVDVAESPIERLKKNRELTTVGKRKGIL